ncbi:dockerin type I domain-containing protein [Gloeobacter kilaueensis]|uniref:dockerin type I domain-containing protein n=1 Tax=Gloeobacter kilaueensis TaxID=1416614 RepID=UPI0003FA254A|nr:dockerin type I domain-containing protein [Gloeobacter kilaueensis]
MAILLGALLAWGPLWAAGSGDVNGDGHFDEQDLAVIDAYLAGTVLLADEQIQAADGDGDGRVSQADRDLLEQRLKELAVGHAPGRIQAESANSGVVLDRATGKPLAGVEIALPDEGVTVRTDSQGRFQLPGATKGKILTVRAANYAPQATAAPGGEGGFRLELERLSPRLVVLDDSLHHLGDDKYGYGSANYREFRLRAEGPRLERTFYLDALPEPMRLRVGSIIGLDTAHSVAMGQSALSQFAGSRPDGLRIYLNGRPLQKIYLNGDNLTVRLPPALLRRGANVLRLETHPLQLPGEADDELARVVRLYGLVNYDDIEFAHLLLIDDSAGGRHIRVQGEILPTAVGP